MKSVYGSVGIGVVWRDRISNGMERLILFDLKRRLLETALLVDRSEVGIQNRFISVTFR